MLCGKGKGSAAVIPNVEHTNDQRESPWQVVFDGSCALCRQSTRVLAKKVAGLPVVFVDGHDAGLSEQEFTEIRVCTPEGQQLFGFAALVTLFALRSRWPWLWKALLRPPFFAIGHWGYRLVAKYRHRLFSGHSVTL